MTVENQTQSAGYPSLEDIMGLQQYHQSKEKPIDKAWDLVLEAIDILGKAHDFLVKYKLMNVKKNDPLR